MTIKKFEKLGFSVNKKFEVNGMIFEVTPVHNGITKFYLRCYSDGKTLLTRANLDTCYNKIIEHAEQAVRN